MENKIITDLTVSKNIDETITEIVEEYAEHIITALQNKEINTAFERAITLSAVIGLLKDIIKETPARATEEFTERYLLLARELKNSIDPDIVH